MNTNANAKALAAKRKMLKANLENAKILRAEIADLRAKVKGEHWAARVMRNAALIEKREIAARRAAERREAAAAKAAARIAKAEARLQALKAREAARAQKAARKSGAAVDVTSRYA